MEQPGCRRAGQFVQTKILDQELGKSEQQHFSDLSKTFKMKALLQFGTVNLQENLHIYDEAIRQAEEIICLIGDGRE